MGSEMRAMTLERPTTSALLRTLGIALACTLLVAATLRAQQTPATTAAGQSLFDGRTLDGWTHVGPGRFVVQSDGSIVGEGGAGVLYYGRSFRDFALDLDYMTESVGATSGVLLRVPAAPKSIDDALKTGYEVRIDNVSTDAIRTTGAIADVAAPSRMAGKPAGQWNHYRIEVTGQRYRVFLNGELVNDFIGERARDGYVALENHDADSRVHFRDVRVAPLQVADAPASLGQLFAVKEQRAPIKVLMVTATTGWRHYEAIDAAKKVMARLDSTTEFDITMTENVADFNPTTLAKYDVLFLSNSTLRAGQPDDSLDRKEGTPNHTDLAPKLTKAQEQAMLDFVRGGKGLVVTHSGVDAFYGSKGYREMIGGGVFQGAPWAQLVRPGREGSPDPPRPPPR